MAPAPRQERSAPYPCAPTCRSWSAYTGSSPCTGAASSANMKSPSRMRRGPGCRSVHDSASRTPPCFFSTPARVGASRSGCAGTRTSASTTTMAMKLSTLTSKTAAAPAAVSRAPAIIGPSRRAALNWAEFSAIAEGSSSRGTKAGTSACQAGITDAQDAPSRKARTMITAGVAYPRCVSTASTAAMIIIAVCPMSSSLRRSCRSARAPAGRASRATGMNSAAERSSTRKGDWVCRWTSHAWATVSIQLPTLLVSEPSQIQRNGPCRSTANGPPAGRGGVRATFTARCSSRRAPGRRRLFGDVVVEASLGRGHLGPPDVHVGSRLRRRAPRLEQVLIGYLEIERSRNSRARRDVDLFLRPFGHPRLRLGLLQHRLRRDEIGAGALPARLGAGARRGEIGHRLLQPGLVLVLLRVPDAAVVERDADVQDQIVAGVGPGEALVGVVVALRHAGDGGQPEEAVVGHGLVGAGYLSDRAPHGERPLPRLPAFVGRLPEPRVAALASRQRRDRLTDQRFEERQQGLPLAGEVRDLRARRGRIALRAEQADLHRRAGGNLRLGVFLAPHRHLLGVARGGEQPVDALQRQVGARDVEQHLLPRLVCAAVRRHGEAAGDPGEEQALRRQQRLAQLKRAVPRVRRDDVDRRRHDRQVRRLPVQARVRGPDQPHERSKVEPLRRAGVIEGPGRRDVRLPGGVGALHAHPRDGRLGPRRGHVGSLLRGQLQRFPQGDRPALRLGCRRGARSENEQRQGHVHIFYPFAAFAGISSATAAWRGTAGAEARPRRRESSARGCSFSIPAKMTGTTRSVSAVEVMTPPMTAMAMGERNSLPVPVPIAVGTMPIAIAKLVMRMGRSRRGPALSSASSTGSPSRMCCSAPSTRRMAFLVTRPISRMTPIIAPSERFLPASRSPRRAPISASGSDTMMVNGCLSDSNCEARTMKMKMNARPKAAENASFCSLNVFICPS